ncbi:MAG: aminomethyltransferase family protein [Betaproteobacteria bacterium]
MLQQYFNARRINQCELTPDVRTPQKFTDPATEHMATRRAAGMFDFSFMACAEITGPDSLSFLHRLQTRNLSSLRPGRIAYTLLLREDGTVLNDATVWAIGIGRYALFIGRRADLKHVRSIAENFDVTIADRSDDHAVIAVQGPRSSSIVAACLTDMPARLSYFDCWSARFSRAACWISRIGYSGELGYEIVVRTQDGPELWEALRRAGAPQGLQECGFDAANSLRIEAGYILFTRELAIPVTPFELGLSRFVDMYPIDFIGLSELRRLHRQLPARQLVGLLPEMAQGADFNELVKPSTDTETTVVVTSLCHSPLFQRVLAMGYVATADRHPGVSVKIAGNIPARVAHLPFYDPGRHLPRQA